MTEHIDQLHALAKALMEREKLNEQEFNTVMAGGTLAPRDLSLIHILLVVLLPP